MGLTINVSNLNLVTHMLIRHDYMKILCQIYSGLIFKAYNQHFVFETLLINLIIRVLTYLYIEVSLRLGCCLFVHQEEN